MIRAKVSEVKNGLSAYLRRVKVGETVLVVERKTPVARIVPAGGEGDGAGIADGDARLVRLEQAGVVVRRGSGSPLDVLDRIGRPDAGLLRALLDERDEERREGAR